MKKWYKTKLWLDLRNVQLSRKPLCEWCHPRITVATEVHHDIPHRGVWSLFNDPDNLVSLCKRCHDSRAQALEKRGYDDVVGDDGWPIDQKHPINRNR
jgi:5-methylcytosine-specific restriction endonuclease McrA